jgi:hypothetical protein
MYKKKEVVTPKMNFIQATRGVGEYSGIDRKSGTAQAHFLGGSLV